MVDRLDLDASCVGLQGGAQKPCDADRSFLASSAEHRDVDRGHATSMDRDVLQGFRPHILKRGGIVLQEPAGLFVREAAVAIRPIAL